MARTKDANATLPYVQRLLDDEYLHQQIRDAVVWLRSVYGRVAQERGQAAEDKKLYDSLRRAATSIRNASVALRQPEPPPKHRGRNLLIIAVAVGATVAIVKVAERQDAATSTTNPPTGADRETATGQAQDGTTAAPS